MHVTLTLNPAPSWTVRLHPDPVDADSRRGAWVATAQLCDMGHGVAEVRATSNEGERRVPWRKAMPLFVEEVRALGFREMRCESPFLYPGWERAPDIGVDWQRLEL